MEKPSSSKNKMKNKSSTLKKNATRKSLKAKKTEPGPREQARVSKHASAAKPAQKTTDKKKPSAALAPALKKKSPVSEKKKTAAPAAKTAKTGSGAMNSTAAAPPLKKNNGKKNGRRESAAGKSTDLRDKFLPMKRKMHREIFERCLEKHFFANITDWDDVSIPEKDSDD